MSRGWLHSFVGRQTKRCWLRSIYRIVRFLGQWKFQTAGSLLRLTVAPPACRHSRWMPGAIASLDMISWICRINMMMLLVAVGIHSVMAQGADAHWPTAAKNGFGTSTTLNSKVWFTLANGVMTEVFFPTLDVPNVQTLQFQVTT